MNTIFYFSGPGNSRHVAETLGRLTGDRLVDMADAGSDVMAGCQPGARLGWVFPVHAWGLPRVVERFIDRMPAMRHTETPYYIYAILTCGDDIGRADRLLRRCLARKGLTVDSVYSVRMPNAYVGLPGFDVDAPALAAEKLNAAERELSLIAADVVARRVGVCRVVPGAWPGLKSGPLRWLPHSYVPVVQRPSRPVYGLWRVSPPLPHAQRRYRQRGPPRLARRLYGVPGLLSLLPRAGRTLWTVRPPQRAVSLPRTSGGVLREKLANLIQ